jgi:hypothetical protein
MLSILYSATVLRFGHFVMLLAGTCLYRRVLQSWVLDIVWCGWRLLVFHTVQCYSLQVWSLCDVVGRYLPSILYSATVLRFGHCVMWLAGTCLPYYTELLSLGLVTMWWLVGSCHPYCLVSQLEDHSMNSYCYQKLNFMFSYFCEADFIFDHSVFHCGFACKSFVW